MKAKFETSVYLSQFVENRTRSRPARERSIWTKISEEIASLERAAVLYHFKHIFTKCNILSQVTQAHCLYHVWFHNMSKYREHMGRSFGLEIC